MFKKLFFIRASFLFTIILTAGACTSHSPGAKQTGPFPIVQGFTDGTSSSFAIVHAASDDLQVKVSLSDRDLPSQQIHVEEHTQPNSPWAVSQVRVSGLKKNQTYELEVQSSDADDAFVDRRLFRTLDLNRNTAKIVVASCMEVDAKYPQKEMWEQVHSHKPDALFLIGDMIYASRKNTWFRKLDPDSFWQTYVDARRNTQLYFMKDLIPVFSIWDDGDFGVSEGGRDYHLKEVAKEYFEAFWPRLYNSKAIVAGPGIAFSLTGFGTRFFFLDDRYFRTSHKPSATPLTASKHLGDEQEKWLFSEIRKTKTSAWLIEGDQFFGGYHIFESFEGSHPENFKTFVDKVKSLPVPVMFVSGDRHLTELMSIHPPEWPYRTFEFTTSALHARTYPSRWEKEPNHRQLHGVAATLNYGVLQMQNQGRSAKVTVTAYGPELKKLYEQYFLVER